MRRVAGIEIDAAVRKAASSLIGGRPQGGDTENGVLYKRARETTRGSSHWKVIRDSTRYVEIDCIH